MIPSSSSSESEDARRPAHESPAYENAYQTARPKLIAFLGGELGDLTDARPWEEGDEEFAEEEAEGAGEM